MSYFSERVQLRPETAHVFDLCARARGFTLRDEHLADLTRPFDWDAFLCAADRHKVTNATYKAFADGISPPPPPDILLKLKGSVTARTALRTMLLSEWRRIAGRFRSDGIEVLIMKGPALSMQLFGNPLIREFRDIDLLANSRDMVTIHAIFSDLGYAYGPDIPDGNAPMRDFLLRDSRHHTYKKKNMPCFFEVHFAHGQDIGLAPSHWNDALIRAERPVFDDLPFPTLQRDDHALLVLIHGAHHGWCQFQWVLDAATLLQNPESRLCLDAPASWPGEDPRYALDAFVNLYEQIFKSPNLEPRVPPQDRASSQRRGGARAALLSRDSFKHLADAGLDFSDSRVEQMHKVFYLTRIRRGTMRKLAFLATLLRPTSGDFLFLGDRCFPITVYYLVRPIRLAAKALRRAFGGMGVKK